MFGSEEKKDNSEKKENRLKWHHYLLSLLFVAVGAVFIGYADLDIPFICAFFAVMFGAAGVVSILSYCFKDIATGYYHLDLVYGMMAVFAAVLFFTKQDVVRVYFPVIAGFIVFANGVIKLQHSIDMKRIDRKMKKVSEAWLVVMIFALVCIAAGAVSVYMTPPKERTLFIFIGISFAVAGLSDIFTHIVFNKKVRQFNSGSYKTETDGASEDKKPEMPEPKKAGSNTAEPVASPDGKGADISGYTGSVITETENTGITGSEVPETTGSDMPEITEENIPGKTGEGSENAADPQD